jgi:hypothetical protein
MGDAVGLSHLVQEGEFGWEGMAFFCAGNGRAVKTSGEEMMARRRLDGAATVSERRGSCMNTSESSKGNMRCVLVFFSCKNTQVNL